MSEEMAVTDNASSEDAKLNDEETATDDAVGAEVTPPEVPVKLEAEEQPHSAAEDDDLTGKLQLEKIDAEDEVKDEKPCVALFESQLEAVNLEAELEEAKMEILEIIRQDEEEEKRGVKRRASTAFGDNGDEEFKGFDVKDPGNLPDYGRVLERLEAEVTAASKSFTPVRSIMATPSAPVRASKRPRQDTDGSRPSSALSSRSDEHLSGDMASPGGRGRRGPAGGEQMSSPLLRVPLERGWRRELVYRAALDAHSRRNADIYYYTPKGKKLRSTREVSEHLSGSGLTLENFSFFKEPLGVDDPEKEIIRDAKMMRRVDSPVASAAVSASASNTAPAEAKRTPKPKQPKGASPEPATPKSPPVKLKVKSMGSRLSNSSPAPPKAVKKAPAPPAAPAADNNNSAAWKKPRPPAPAPVAAPAPAVTPPVAATQPAVTPPPPPPPLQSRPPQLTSSEQQRTPARQVVQPCSLTCGRGVPSLACAACLCLYHPACAPHYAGEPQFYCKNCRKSTSPCSEPPPLTHKSGVTTSSMAVTVPVPAPRRVHVPVPVPVPVPRQIRPEKRVLLRMKAATSGAEGERVWAVAGTGAAQKTSGGVVAGPAGGRAGTLPQALVKINGRRFIVVGRAMLQPPQSMSIDE